MEGVEQRENREKGKETCTHISNYLFKLPSRHIDLHHNCNMNLDSTCMEMKCLKRKYIENQNLRKCCSSGLNQYLIFNGNNGFI